MVTYDKLGVYVSGFPDFKYALIIRGTYVE